MCCRKKGWKNINVNINVSAPMNVTPFLLDFIFLSKMKNKNYFVWALIMLNIALILFLVQHFLYAIFYLIDRLDFYVDVLRSYGYHSNYETIFWFIPINSNVVKILVEIMLYIAVFVCFVGIVFLYLGYFKKGIYNPSTTANLSCKSSIIKSLTIIPLTKSSWRSNNFFIVENI